MSIATEIQELTQNTAELDGIRTDIRTALAGKGVSASDHDYADFATDISSIPSGGGGNTNGQFFPMNMSTITLPTMNLTCEGVEI